MENELLEKRRKSLNLVRLLSILVAFVLIVLWFMPLFRTVSRDNEDAKQAAGWIVNHEENNTNFTERDLLSPSLLTLTRYCIATNDSTGNVFVLIPLGASVLLLLCALAKLPWLMLIIGAVNLVDYNLLDEAFHISSRISDGELIAGITGIAYKPCLCVMAVLIIWMMIAKGKYKRALKKTKG